MYTHGPVDFSKQRHGAPTSAPPNQPPPAYSGPQWNAQTPPFLSSIEHFGTETNRFRSQGSVPRGNPTAPPPMNGNNRAPMSGTQPAKPMDTVKLYNNPREREQFENMADLFSIIKTTEALEKAYVRDAISAEEYKKQFGKLATQFKAAQNLTKIESPVDLRRFMQEYRLNCPAAEKRLIEGDILSGGTIDDTARTVAETVQHFITLMDSLKLNMTAVDQIHPLLTDLLESLSKISSLAVDWEGKVKIKNWLVMLNKMKASDSLNDDQIRQMLFDLESAYSAFHKSLQK